MARLTEEVKHMPIVVRPEEGFLKALQDKVLTLIWEKIELVPKGVEVKKLTNSWSVFELFDREAL